MSPHGLFYPSGNFDFYISGVIPIRARNPPGKPNNCLMNKSRTKGEGLSTTNKFSPLVISLLVVPRWQFVWVLGCFMCYLLLFLLLAYCL